MHTVAETSEFARRVRTLLTEQERFALIAWLSEYPQAGVVLEGTGGVRKLRWARQGAGKSGGVRVIYYYHNEGLPLYLLTLYGKNEQDNLSAAQRNELGKFVQLLVRAAGLN